MHLYIYLHYPVLHLTRIFSYSIIDVSYTTIYTLLHNDTILKIPIVNELYFINPDIIPLSIHFLILGHNLAN